MSDIAIVLVVILVVLLLFRGPRVLPQLGAALGRGVREARENLDRSGDDEQTAEDASRSTPR